MVSILPLISRYSVLFFWVHRDCSKSSINDWNHYRLYVPQLFQLSGKINIFVHFFLFFDFHLYMTSSFLLVNQNYVWSSSLDWVIYLYLDVPDNSKCFFCEDDFWFVQIISISKEKFQFLSQFTVGHLSNPVTPSLLCQFAVFTYAINRFINVTT